MSATPKPVDLRQRTQAYAVEIVTFAKSLPRDWVAMTLGKQLLRSGTSIAANYRAARRARSTAEFVSKLGIAEEEADETVFWLDVLVEAGVVPADRARPLLKEAGELVSIIVASIKTSRARSLVAPGAARRATS